MGGVGYFFYLALLALFIFQPVDLLIAAGVIGCVWLWPSQSPDLKRQALAAMLVPMALPLAILLCGVFFAHDRQLEIPAPRWPEILVVALLLAHLPLAVFLAWRLAGVRLFAVWASAAVLGYSLLASFLSLSSVTGEMR